jgi:hypothetical protein
MSLYSRNPDGTLVELKKTGFRPPFTEVYEWPAGLEDVDALFYYLFTENCENEEGGEPHVRIICGLQGEKLVPQKEISFSPDEKNQTSFLHLVSRVVVITCTGGGDDLYIDYFYWEKVGGGLYVHESVQFFGGIEKLKKTPTLQSFVSAAEAALEKFRCNNTQSVPCSHVHYAL